MTLMTQRRNIVLKIFAEVPRSLITACSASGQCIHSAAVRILLSVVAQGLLCDPIQIFWGPLGRFHPGFGPPSV